MDEFGNPTMYINEFELHDFTDGPNFDQFIDLIRGENKDPVAGFDCDLINGCFIDNQFGSTNENMFDFDGESTMESDDLTFVLNSSLSSLNGVIKKGGDQEEENDRDDSSGTTRSTRKTKTDRSRTLISEKRRRGRMKEKLYALRALVPNITKMDKASIVGDAVLHVQELQMQANKLRAEIAGLEASLADSERYQETIKNPKKTQVRGSNLQPAICKKIVQIEVFQVEERGFYLRLVSNKGEGVAVSLYKALESLTSFNVRNSNLATESERFVLTFILNVRDCEKSMNLSNLKLWVTGALLNQGFDFLTPLSA